LNHCHSEQFTASTRAAQQIVENDIGLGGILVTALGSEMALLDNPGTLQAFVAAVKKITVRNCGEKAHRSILEHHAHHQSPALHRAIADYAVLVKVAAVLVSIGTPVVAGNLRPVLKHGERDFLHRGATSGVGNSKAAATGDAYAFPHTGHVRAVCQQCGAID
jgi:hypothetical protein